MTLGTPPTSDQIEDRPNVRTRRPALRRLLLLAGVAASFGVLMIIMSSNANAAPLNKKAGLDQLLSPVQSTVRQLTDIVGATTAPVVKPLHQVSASLATATIPVIHAVVKPVRPVTDALKPTTAPVLDAVAPVTRPVVADLVASSAESTTSTTSAMPSLRSTMAGARQFDAEPGHAKRIRLANRMSAPAAPERNPGAPSPSSALALTGSGSSVSGSTGGHGAGNAVAETSGTDTRWTSRWPIWSPRQFAAGACYVHGRDHPR